MNAAFEAFEFVFYSKLLFFERRDPGFVPIGVGHFSGDNFFKFSMLYCQMLDLSLLSHATPHRFGRRKLKHQPLCLSPEKEMEPTGRRL